MCKCLPLQLLCSSVMFTGANWFYYTWLRISYNNDKPFKFSLHNIYFVTTYFIKNQIALIFLDNVNSSQRLGWTTYTDTQFLWADFQHQFTGSSQAPLVQELQKFFNPVETFQLLVCMNNIFLNQTVFFNFLFSNKMQFFQMAAVSSFPEVKYP